MGVTYFFNNQEGKKDYIQILKENKKVVGSLELSGLTRSSGIDGLQFTLGKDASKEDRAMLRYIARRQLKLEDWSDECYYKGSEKNKAHALVRGDSILIYDPKSIAPVMKKLMEHGEFCVVVGEVMGNTVLTGDYTDRHTEAILDYFMQCLQAYPYSETSEYMDEYGKDLQELREQLNKKSTM